MAEISTPPLEISCTSFDCANDLHCFKQLKRMTPGERGKCRECGIDLVDWHRLHLRDIKDAEHTFEALQYELIRHHFFHKKFNEQEISHAQRKGMLRLKVAARVRLSKYLAPAKPYRDGRQTPMRGTTIYFAQHATATCCRTCLEYWHAIPKGRNLTNDEFEYCVKLVNLFLDLRLPKLGEKPIKVPRKRTTRPTPVEIYP